MLRGKGDRAKRERGSNERERHINESERDRRESERGL